jgi:GT2 family glycosyltransferase
MLFTVSPGHATTWIEPIPATVAVGDGNVLLVQGWTTVPVGQRARVEVELGTERQELPFRHDPQGRRRFWIPVTVGSERIGTSARLRASLISTRGRVVLVDQQVGFVRHAAGAAEPVRTPVVICMATFEPDLRLFRRQVASLVGQTFTDWTCLVQDDASRPEVFAEIARVCGDDPRFLVARNPANLGFYRNFERCLTRVPAGVEFVALCDQDDDWYPDKLAASLDAFRPGVELVYGDMRIVDGAGHELAPSFWSVRRNNHRSFATLLFANTVTGAASVFRRSLLDKALPFPPPTGAAMHDHWLALVAMSAGRLAYLDRPLFDHVQHGDNAVGHALEPPPRWTTIAAQKARRLARTALRPRLAPGHLQETLDRYVSDYGRLALVRSVLAQRFPDLPRDKARALDLFAGRWRDVPRLLLASIGVALRRDTTSRHELSLAMVLAVHKAATAWSRRDSRAARAVAEAAWWAFYLPRGGVQELARHAPLAKLRDRLPTPLAERLRFALYPGRITDPRQRDCVREHPPWGTPAVLDPARPVEPGDGAPRVSILMVTHGNLALTRLCLASLQRAAGPTRFEVIVVDNGSTDGTVELLLEVARSRLLPLTVIAEPDNRGFAASTNRAARAARGEILCLLNNDTVVTPGWLERLVAHLDRDGEVGLVGPVTNSCGNEAALGTPYHDLDGMFAFARAQMDRVDDRPRDLDMLSLFCAAIPRRLWDELGGLDERYQVGMFEDDDLSVAVRRAGRRVVLARDVFVHHYGGATFALLSRRRYLRVWWENRRRFEAKWGVEWQAR